ncbi:NAD(P)-dependent oxidoreductase [Nonomuraea sp. NPDC003201]
MNGLQLPGHTGELEQGTGSSAGLLVVLRCAVLDDYQGAALGLADWSRVRVAGFRDHFTARDDLVAALRDYEIVVIVRERTPFPAEVLDRPPNLRPLITSGMRNASVDVAAARARGVTVCGTASSVHLVLSDRTRGLIGERELSLMRPASYLVNTSRAAIVDQEALVAALRAGRGRRGHRRLPRRSPDQDPPAPVSRPGSWRGRRPS